MEVILMKNYTTCFFGHRKIDETEGLKNNLRGIIENLIVNEKVDTFFFGSNSQFDDLYHKIVTELKENILTSNGYMSGRHFNIFPIGTRIVCFSIMKIHTSRNIWRTQAELPMWSEIRK